METRKGSIFDVVFLLVAIFLIAAGMLIVHTTTNALYTALEDQGFTEAELEPAGDGLTAIADWNIIIVFIYTGVGLATVISAFAIRTHPIFYIMFFLVQVVLIALAGPLGSAYTEIASNPSLAASATVFAWTGLLIGNLPLAVLVVSVLVAIAMFALP